MSKTEAEFQKALEGMEFSERARVEIAAGEIKQVLERHGQFGVAALGIVASMVANALTKEEWNERK